MSLDIFEVLYFIDNLSQCPILYLSRRPLLSKRVRCVADQRGSSGRHLDRELDEIERQRAGGGGGGGGGSCLLRGAADLLSEI